MPVSRDNKIRNIEIGQTQCDCRQEMTHEDYFRFVEHFVRFLFMLNKLIRVASCTHEAIHRVSGELSRNSPTIKFLYARK